MGVDTGRLAELAAEVRTIVDDLQREAAELRRAVDDVPWHGHAAEAFRASARAHLGVLSEATAQADAAARALLDHAARVERRRAALVHAAEAALSGVGVLAAAVVA